MHVASAPSQVCRCLPFIHRIHQVDEVVTLTELRRIIKSQFLQYKDVKDPRVRMCKGGGGHAWAAQDVLCMVEQKVAHVHAPTA